MSLPLVLRAAAVPIFDAILFGWLFWNARATLRSGESPASAT